MGANNQPAKKSVYFSIATIVAMNIAIIINIYGFPSEAFYGLTSISLYGIALIIFLIPVALVSAELGSMFAGQGGIFQWVSNAFGYRPAIVATWLQWVQSIFFYPISLTFAAVTFSYVFPDSIVGELATNKVYIIAFVLVVFWFCTLAGTRGLKHIGKLSSLGVWIGIVVPVALLIAFGIYYIIAGGKIEMDTSAASLIPKFRTMDDVVMAASILLFFSGLEVNGVHVYMMKDPGKGYPKALFWTCVVIGIIYILGTLSVAVIIPSGDLSITQSVIVAFKHYLGFSHLSRVLPFIAIALAFGVVANSITWITGPASVMKYIADNGYLPKVVAKENKHGAPLFILISQGVIVSVIVFVYALSPQVQQGYQMLMQMTNAIYLTMYVILFVAFLRLRYKERAKPRPFRVGKGNFLAWVVGIVGILGAAGTFVLCFFPPAQLDISKQPAYIGTVAVIYACLILPPVLYVIFHKPKVITPLKK